MIKLTKPLVLTGMMGSGKTSIGQRLARLLQMGFVDLDQEIEREQKATINDIFSKYGEAAFRKIEKQKLALLVRQEPMVIATGGGAVLDEGTRAMLHEEAITVWLKVDVEVLAKRIHGDDTRPLLKGDDPKRALLRILQQREAYYAQAPITIPNNGSNIDTAVEEILKAVQKYGKGVKIV
jgi:shikimate kinase